MPSANSLTKFLLAAVGISTLIMGVLILIHPPAIYPDPSWGYQVMRCMHMGGAFNILSSPDHLDIAKNNYGFMSWWSPGQYLAPYVAMGVFGLTVGRATALIVILCCFKALIGFYAFFKKIGFTPLVSAISIAFIAAQQAYFIPFVFYNGGEVILFAFLGWFLYGCVYFERASWLMMLFVLLSGIIGFFCKSSFLWIFIAGMLFLWIRISAGKKLVGWLLNGISIGIPAVISLAMIYFGYLAKGDNPAASANGLKFTWQALGFPMASPLLSAFSIDDLSGGIMNHPAGILLLLTLLSLMLLWLIWKFVPGTRYRLLLLTFYIVSVLFYSINFLRQADISFEARHMRLLGLIVTPGIIYLFSQIKRPYWALLGLIWIFILYKNYKFLSTGYDRNANWSAHGTTGLAQVFIDQPTLNYLQAIDRQQHNAIFAFISADLGLEIKHNRIITLDRLNDNLQTEHDLDPYQGHAGPLYIIVPKSYDGAKIAVYIKSFPGYHNFIKQNPGKEYSVYSAQ